MDDKQFVNGMYASRPKNAPDFIKMKISLKRDEFLEFMRTTTKEDVWIYIDIKESKAGKLYAERNTWKKPEDKDESINDNNSNIEKEDIPF